MSFITRADTPYDFSPFKDFFHHIAGPDSADDAQNDFENSCKKIDHVLHCGTVSLPFLELFFHLNYIAEDVPERLKRFSYLGPRYVQRIGHNELSSLHEAYFIGKFYSSTPETQSLLTTRLAFTNLCPENIYSVMNSDGISDFFTVHPNVDFRKCVALLLDHDIDMESMCRRVKSLLANYFACKIVSAVIYYLSRNMYTHKKGFYSDFVERHNFVEWVSKKFLLHNIFDLNYQIIYNFDCYSNIVLGIYELDAKYNSEWCECYWSMLPSENFFFIFSQGTTDAFPYVYPSLEKSLYDFHKTLNETVYSKCVYHQLEIAEIMLEFKNHFARTHFYIQDLSPLWQHFVSSLKDLDAEIPYTLKFLVLTTNHVKKIQK